MAKFADSVAAAVRQFRDSLLLQATRQAAIDTAGGPVLLDHPAVPSSQPAARVAGFPEVAEGAD
jgi:hypothetical protein